MYIQGALQEGPNELLCLALPTRCCRSSTWAKSNTPSATAKAMCLSPSSDFHLLRADMWALKPHQTPNVYSLFELEIKVISLKHLILGQILWHGNYYTVKGNHTSSQRETEAIIMLLAESKRCSCFLVNTVLFFCVTCKLSQNLRKLAILTSLLSYLQCSYSVTSLCIWIANITVCRSWLLSRTVYETHLREEASLAFTLLPNKWPVAERLIKDEKAIFSKFWNKASIV